MPFLYLTNPDDNDNTVRNLTLVYDFNEMIFTEESGWTDESRYDTLDYIVTLNNMKVVLNTKYYCDVPLAMDVDSWVVDETADIGIYSAVVVESASVHGYDCWLCEIGNESTVCYDKISGVFVRSEQIDSEYQRVVQLEEMIFTAPFQPYVRDEGVLLAAIFVELAVIVWLLAERLKKSD